MKSLGARLSVAEPAERRDAVRWHVELIVNAGPADGPGRAMVRNLSQTGLMLATDAGLQVGDRIVVELPGAEAVDAVVKWHRQEAYGCEFLTPIAPAVVSAVLLKAPLCAPHAGDADPEMEEFAVGTHLSIGEIADWKTNFERTKGQRGYRLIAYRQASDGLLIAVAIKPQPVAAPN